jgi:hypothetical protein
MIFVQRHTDRVLVKNAYCVGVLLTTISGTTWREGDTSGQGAISAVGSVFILWLLLLLPEPHLAAISDGG